MNLEVSSTESSFSIVHIYSLRLVKEVALGLRSAGYFGLVVRERFPNFYQVVLGVGVRLSVSTLTFGRGKLSHPNKCINFVINVSRVESQALSFVLC